MKRFLFFTQLIFLLVFYGLIFLSCTDSPPQVSTVQSTLVFDFEDESSLPQMRLSIFAETSGDVHRAQEIRVYNDETGMEWSCPSPQKISSSDKKSWAGYRNFAPATDSLIPQGRYTLYYTDLAERECTAVFNVNYQEEHAKMKSPAFPDAIKGGRTEKLCVYDASGVMIYWGERKRNWKKDEDIVREYGTAVKYRVCYYTNGSTVAYLMPEVSLVQK